jgi:putative transposase
MKLFTRDEDFLAFERVLAAAQERHPIRILSWCIMSNHWHFVVWPKKEGELTAFFRWLAHTHAMRWRVSRHTVGYGHLYQGRFKSLPVQADEHLLTVCRYVERNALTAGLVKRAEQWRWSSLWVRMHGEPEQKALLTDWPVEMPADWIKWVNTPITAKELDRLKLTLERGRPFGSDRWVARTAKALKLEHTLRREGRPSLRPESAAKRGN